MKQSPEYSPGRRRLLVTGLALASKPILDAFGSRIAHAEEIAPESGSAQLIRAIEATARSIPEPVYAKGYQGRNIELETQGAWNLQVAIAAATVGGLPDAKWLIDKSRKDNNFLGNSPGHVSLFFITALDNKTIDDLYPNLAASKNTPIALFERTISDPPRHEIIVVLNPDEKIAANDAWNLWLVAHTAEYARQSDLKIRRLVASGISDSNTLHSRMLGPEVQQELKEISRSYANRETLKVLKSETGPDWKVSDNLQVELQATILEEEPVASDETPLNKLPETQTPSN